MAKRLMHSVYEEFEKLITNCMNIFNTWDDEMEKLYSFLKEIAKKKREDITKLNWLMNFGHKSLQIRLENLKKSEKNFNSKFKIFL